MTFTKKAAALVAAAAAVGLALAGCGAGSPSSEPGSAADGGSATTVTIGLTSSTAPPTILPLVAQKLGIASQYHINIAFKNISPDVTAQALSTKAIDVLAAPSVEQAILQGAKFKVIAGAAKPYFSLWGKKGSVSDWSSLKGKKVGIPAGRDSAAAVLFNALLKQHGLAQTDVTIQYNSAQSNYDALSSGAIDAGLTTPPYTYQLESTGKFAQIDALTDAQQGYLSTEFTASQQFIDAHKDAVADFVQMLQATEKRLQSPVSQDVLDAVIQNLQANGIKPDQFDVKRFLTQLSDTKTWQVIPTKKIITADLSLLKQLPSLSSAANSAKFEEIVYAVPSLADAYNG